MSYNFKLKFKTIFRGGKKRDNEPKLVGNDTVAANGTHPIPSTSAEAATELPIAPTTFKWNQSLPTVAEAISNSSESSAEPNYKIFIGSDHLNDSDQEIIAGKPETTKDPAGDIGAPKSTFPENLDEPSGIPEEAKFENSKEESGIPKEADRENSHQDTETPRNEIWGNSTHEKSENSKEIISDSDKGPLDKAHGLEKMIGMYFEKIGDTGAQQTAHSESALQPGGTSAQRQCKRTGSLNPFDLAMVQMDQQQNTPDPEIPQDSAPVPAAGESPNSTSAQVTDIFNLSDLPSIIVNSQLDKLDDQDSDMTMLDSTFLSSQAPPPNSTNGEHVSDSQESCVEREDIQSQERLFLCINPVEIESPSPVTVETVQAPVENYCSSEERSQNKGCACIIEQNEVSTCIPECLTRDVIVEVADTGTFVIEKKYTDQSENDGELRILRKARRCENLAMKVEQEIEDNELKERIHRAIVGSSQKLDISDDRNIIEPNSDSTEEISQKDNERINFTENGQIASWYGTQVSINSASGRHGRETKENGRASREDSRTSDLFSDMVGLVDVYEIESHIARVTEALNKGFKKFRHSQKAIERLVSYLDQLKREQEELNRLLSLTDRQTLVLHKQVKQVKVTLAAVSDSAIAIIASDSQAQKLEPTCFRKYLAAKTANDTMNVLTSIRNRQKALGELELLTYRKQLVLQHALPTTVQEKPLLPTKKRSKKSKNSENSSHHQQHQTTTATTTAATTTATTEPECDEGPTSVTLEIVSTTAPLIERNSSMSWMSDSSLSESSLPTPSPTSITPTTSV